MRYRFVIIFLIFSSTMQSQTDLHIAAQYTTKEGLSNNMIYSMTVDKRGFLWLGTKEGLSRYDGFTFKTYFSEKNNPNSLPSDNVFDLAEYRLGQLLIATSNGLSVLNTLTGKFENEKIGFAPLRAGSGATINSLYVDKLSNVWVNHNGELDVLDSNLTYVQRFTDLDWARSLKGIFVMFEDWFTDRKGRLWLPSDTSGLHIVDFAAKKVYNSKNNPQQFPFLTSQPIRAFLNDEETNTLWYAPWGEGLMRYNFSTGSFQQQNFGISVRGEGSTVNSIVKTGSGKLLCFIGSNTDTRCYEINNTTLEYKLLSEKSTLNSPGNGVVTSLAVQSAGIDQVLIGSSRGLYYLSGGEAPYKNLSLVKQVSDMSINDCTDMIVSGSGKVYCTFANNLLVSIEKNRKDFTYHRLPGKSNTVILEVCEDRSGRLWIGTGKGIYFFDTADASFTRPRSFPDALQNAGVNVIHCDNDGDIWIATRDPFGLYRFNVASNSVQKINNSVTRHFESLGGATRISAMADDRQGRLWMISRIGGGLICYEKKQDQWKLYPQTNKNHNLLASKGLVSLCAGDSNFLWLSTYFGDGLIRYDYKNDNLVQFTRHDGLPGNYVLNITSDKAQHLWLTTENGITQFDPFTRKVRQTIFFPELPIAEQNIVSDHLDGAIIVSLNDQLLFIPSRAIPANNSFPQPVIDRITVNNKVRFIDPQNQQLSLGHDQKNISIDFTAVGLFNNRQVQFAYMLTGVDKDWIYPDANRTAQYSILAPGNYTFQLKAGNEAGIWNPARAIFSFSIATPWWQTTLFRLTVILLIAAIIGLVFIKRVQVIRREAGMKHKIAETEMMALRAQMNPHFIFNCLSSIDNLIQNNEKEKATTYLAKFAKLIRAILENSKNNAIPCWKDMETLELYLELEELRCDRQFSYKINIETEVLHGDYKVPPLVIQPFVENAIHHGLMNKKENDKELFISVCAKNNEIRYVIKDNGVGRNKAAEYKRLNKSFHNSMGMDITMERINLVNRQNGSVKITDLYNEQEHATGTKVEIWLTNQN